MSKYQRIYKKKQASEVDSESVDETKRGILALCFALSFPQRKHLHHSHHTHTNTAAELDNLILQVKGRREYVFDSYETTIAQVTHASPLLCRVSC
jgi:hypothetical protein